MIRYACYKFVKHPSVTGKGVKLLRAQKLIYLVFQICRSFAWMEPMIESDNIRPLIQPATVHPWRVSRPFTTLGGRSVSIGKADGINWEVITGQCICWSILYSWYVFSNNGEIMPSFQEIKHCNMWAMNFSLQYPEDSTNTTAILSQLSWTLFPCQPVPHTAAAATIGSSSFATMHASLKPG